MSLFTTSQSLGAELVRIRRELHQIPEVGLQLPATQAMVLGELSGLPLEITLGQGCSSITAVLRGSAPGRDESEPNAVLLRADMDALPVCEEADVDFASLAQGRMHACGHDMHTAMLIGAARLLSEHRDQLPGDVVFMFQPGEEGYDGASVMIREGVLDAAGSRVKAAFGMHVMSRQPYGRFATVPGAMMSASDGLFVTVRGCGGHGASPHGTRDPIPAMSEMVTALQTMVARQFSIFDPVVLTVGKIRAGEQRNVISDTAYFEATVRSFSKEAREQIRASVQRFLEGIASAHGVQVEIDYREEYPVTVNDPDEVGFAGEAVASVFGAKRFHILDHPMNGSEDFSRILNEVPGCMIILGAAPEGIDPETMPFNHSPRVSFDDGVLADGATLYANLASRALRKLASDSTSEKVLQELG